MCLEVLGTCSLHCNVLLSNFYTFTLQRFCVFPFSLEKMREVANNMDLFAI